MAGGDNYNWGEDPNVEKKEAVKEDTSTAPQEQIKPESPQEAAPTAQEDTTQPES